MLGRIIYRWSSDRALPSSDVLCGGKALNIGQTLSCDLRMPECAGYEPEVFATILPGGEGKSPVLVCRTDFYEMHVNGKRVEMAVCLSYGDEIVFTFPGGRKRIAVLLYEKPKKKYSSLLWLSSVAAAMALILAGLALMKRDRLLRHEDFSEYERCVYQIVTDSVFLVEKQGEKEFVHEALALEKLEKGTCFLTDGGLFVTARHCVEPWIVDDRWDGKADMAGVSSALKLAVRAETMNHELGEMRYSVRSHCVISCGEERLDFYSDSFRFDKSRDKILSLGDYENPVYMRTIIPIAGRRNMELGDFAYVEAGDRKGDISLAGMEDLLSFDSSSEMDVVIMGYPINDNRTDRLNTIAGVSQRLDFNHDGSDLEGCIQMSAGISHGYSGGPVFARVNRKLMVVGLVSKYDTNAEFTSFWAVPSTEVLKLYDAGGEAEDDVLMFRR